MAYEYEESNKKTVGAIWQKHAKENRLRELQEVYRKAKAFDTFLKYKEHVEKYNNSDCHELERVFEFVMKEYEEDE